MWDWFYNRGLLVFYIIAARLYAPSHAIYIYRCGCTAAVLFSLMTSCIGNQVEPWAYLRDLIMQLAQQLDA